MDSHSSRAHPGDYSEQTYCHSKELKFFFFAFFVLFAFFVDFFSASGSDPLYRRLRLSYHKLHTSERESSFHLFMAKRCCDVDICPNVHVATGAWGLYMQVLSMQICITSVILGHLSNYELTTLQFVVKMLQYTPLMAPANRASTLRMVTQS